MCTQNREIFHPNLPPQPPPPPKKNLAAGNGSPVGKLFFKTSHMSVQNDERNDGIILRYVCWGTRHPRTAPPPPRPRTPPHGAQKV